MQQSLSTLSPLLRRNLTGENSFRGQACKLNFRAVLDSVRAIVLAGGRNSVTFFDARLTVNVRFRRCDLWLPAARLRDGVALSTLVSVALMARSTALSTALREATHDVASLPNDDASSELQKRGDVTLLSLSQSTVAMRRGVLTLLSLSQRAAVDRLSITDASMPAGPGELFLGRFTVGPLRSLSRSDDASVFADSSHSSSSLSCFYHNSPNIKP